MHLWHLEQDTPLRPEHAAPGEPVVACVGTWPIEPGQAVWATFEVRCSSGRRWQLTKKGHWIRNEGPNSYWEIELGRFEGGETVSYKVLGEDRLGAVVATREFSTTVEEPPPSAGGRARAAPSTAHLAP